MECLRGKTFAIVDVETSGMSAVFNRIIEIGILRVEDGIVVETYKTCVNPGRSISPWITRLTGIRQEEVENAPAFEDIVDDVERLLSGAIFVAHNVRFDYSFIQNEFRGVGRNFHATCLCTVRLSRALFPRAKHHGLSHLIARHGFTCESRHRAFDDAAVLWDFLRLCESKHEAKLDAAIEKILVKPSVPQVEFEPVFFAEDREPVIQ